MVGMIASPMIGALINDNFGFTWVFNFNSGALCLVLAVSQFYIPHDEPVELPDSGSSASQQGMITVGDLLRRFNCFTVFACTTCAVFCMVIKEAIFEPTFENYFGLVGTETAHIAMLEGYTMIATSLLIALIPDSKKNYNKLTLIGAMIFSVAIFVEGPITLIEPARKEGVYWAASGVALLGIGEAFIMLHSMSALEESLSGVYPASKLGEVSNAMGSLISAANGAGSSLGTIIGAFIFSLCGTHFCLELPSEGF
jgi:predicted MFS family arabinose efflux permease